MVQLIFPPNVEVKVLVEYVSKRMGINFLYDESVGAKRVTIASPAKVPKDSLMGLLQSVLKMANLTMINGDQPGWKKIVPGQNLLSVTGDMHKEPTALAGADATSPMTQIFQLSNSSPATIEPIMKPFLSQPGGNSFSIADKNLLIVTDYAGNLRRIATLIELMDKPGAKATFQFVPARNLDAAELARQATAFLAERDKVSPGKAQARMTISSEPRTNQVVVIATEGADKEALDLIAQLDMPTTAKTHTYQLKHISPQRIDKLTQDYIGAEPMKRLYKATMDAESGLLIVTAPAGVHEYVTALIRDLDIAGSPSNNYVHFYKLMNTTASTVLATIRSLETGDKGVTALNAQGPFPSPATDNRFTGPNNPPAAPGQEWPTPPAYHPTTTAPAGEQSAPAASVAVKTKDATVTADTNTNTIIVIAPPPVQETYKQLINILDKRRPQVMIEVTLVTLDTSNGFSFGVELARKGNLGSENPYVLFNSFGLSTIDPKTGTPTINPSLGLNGVLLSPDTVSVVIKALASCGKSKVMSAPKVLVNDNASAALESISEAPYTSINASQTVSTTSFAGYASAGTNITVTPHISEGDHLQLQYSVTLSAFTGQSSSDIPPPRQTNTVNSSVTIPDGYAVVVGGLTRKDSSETVSKIPILGDIPIIKYAFSSTSVSESQSTLYVFIRPVILRDDRFEDLKYLSDQDLSRAELPPNLPTSTPLLLK